MKKKSATPPADPEQRERFVATARELGCDETGEAFEKAFGKIVPEKRPQRDLERKVLK